jgi:hypothetical protein
MGAAFCSQDMGAALRTAFCSQDLMLTNTHFNDLVPGAEGVVEEGRACGWGVGGVRWFLEAGCGGGGGVPQRDRDRERERERERERARARERERERERRHTVPQSNC